ncbi:cleavage and polyadenylation specificity factor subunit 4 [Clonorchis sinensis]|uniref:Cleavage and polyadenylation specificity factor subunit 4 n=1 Tax=Clonorchis sinensis TaxID=79923 RepID=G7Y7G6_CLOSI|nr:cleavage and polyadenylation specificity factor subunit 4 [Clonorchis sinensis]
MTEPKSDQLKQLRQHFANHPLALKIQKNGILHFIKSERGHKIQFCLKLPPEERLRLQEQQRAQNMGNAVGGAGAGQAGSALGGRFQSERLKYGGLMNFTQTATAATGPRQGPQKPLDEVTCFKCGEKGHYANRCNKGYLAFLSKVSLQQNDGDGARG